MGNLRSLRIYGFIGNGLILFRKPKDFLEGKKDQVFLAHCLYNKGFYRPLASGLDGEFLLQGERMNINNLIFSLYQHRYDDSLEFETITVEEEDGFSYYDERKNFFFNTEPFVKKEIIEHEKEFIKNPFSHYQTFMYGWSRHEFGIMPTLPKMFPKDAFGPVIFDIIVEDVEVADVDEELALTCLPNAIVTFPYSWNIDQNLPGIFCFSQFTTGQAWEGKYWNSKPLKPKVFSRMKAIFDLFGL